MTIDVHAILQQLVPDTYQHEQIIIAAGSEDFPPSEILNWLDPMLAGLPRQSWSYCDFHLRDDNTVHAVYRDSQSVESFALLATWTEAEAGAFRQLLPHESGLAIVTINAHTSQIFTLTDQVASWLNIFDMSQPELRPLFRVLSTLARMSHLYQ